MKNIIVTGGAGYIGSHTVLELINCGYNPIIIDNFSNSNKEVINRLKKIAKKDINVIDCDIRNKKLLIETLINHECQAVIHFAGFKAVQESELDPLMYYSNNLNGSISLLEAMKETKIKKLVFSSSATVYGQPKILPLKEDHPLSPESVYGKTKLIFENILKDIHKADTEWRICILRYFNPVGAHKSGMIGDDPRGIPNNLMPFISQVAVGRRSHLNVWGNDYETKDGTGVRDYIHVIDLAKGHIKAIEKINDLICSEINLGTGRGYSVLEIIRSFENSSRKKIKFKFKKRREGDIDANYADPSKAEKMLNWKAKLNIDDMCRDTWNWQQKNPNGCR